MMNQSTGFGQALVQFDFVIKEYSLGLIQYAYANCTYHDETVEVCLLIPQLTKCSSGNIDNTRHT